MSYKTTILSDYPLAYYPLDDLTTGDVPDFNDILAQFATYQDVLNYYSSYSNMVGTTAFDYSGCSNHGTYSGAPETRILPLVPGNSMATKITNTLFVNYGITNNYYGTPENNIFGNKYSSDSEFSIEFWFYPSIASSSEIPLVADETENVGVFYENGNISFKLDSETLTHTLMDLDKASHIVAVYSINYAYLYVNGLLVSSKSLNNFKFSNTNLSLSSGPTPINNYFLINSVAVYSYSLPSNKIFNHYEAAYGMFPIQVVYPLSGELFQIRDDSPSYEFKYSYPGNKPWSNFTTDELAYISSEDSLAMIQTESSSSKTIIIDEYISLPYAAAMDSSKIEWTATKGVSVESSVDGINFVSCENNSPIPQYSLGNFNSSKQLYLRITMTSSNSNKFLPRIKNLIVKFYNNQILYSKNGASYISTLEGSSGITEFDISIGNEYSPILQRSIKNGIHVSQDSGFFVNTSRSVKGLEFFYTPEDILDSGLINVVSAGSGYSAANLLWHNSATISKTNIQYLYVNGQNVTSETVATNIFKPGQIHHVFIVFATPVSGHIKFADSQYGSVKCLFQNIALYGDSISNVDAVNNYNLYISGSVQAISDSSSQSVLMTENSVNYYDNDWTVVLGS